MPIKTRKPQAAPALPRIAKELIDQFVNGSMSVGGERRLHGVQEGTD
ncbi:MAG: hypothetical protein QE265_03360 [Rhodoferax sp.]|nr:hypothetical protein [Rhodoferax sp.]